MLKTIASKLETIIEGYLPQLKELTEADFMTKPTVGQWSGKEIMGHLVDSAENNIRRFIVAQYEDNSIIQYNQDKWVLINDYQHQDLNDILHLWYLLNKQVVSILKNTPDEMAHRSSKTDAIYTIEWLANDYIQHMAHHLHQVLNLEPIAYPN